jgi:hypothetical protein
MGALARQLVGGIVGRHAMAERISIQIALEGGREIERQLAGIGEAGN